MRLRKLARLSPREWRDLLVAQVALLWAQLLVWRRPTGHLVASDGAPRASLSPLDAEQLRRAESIALAVGRAAEHGVFRPLCLVRAVALNRLLESNGIHGSRIRIGVRVRGGRFAAHAWVEHGDKILGDQEWHVSSFAELADVRLVDAP
jgi:hypothetical protein